MSVYCDTSEHVHLQTFTETDAENKSGNASSWYGLLTRLCRAPSAGEGATSCLKIKQKEKVLKIAFLSDNVSSI